MTSRLPREVPVTGTDWFLLAFDRAMRSGSGAAAVCHLVVELDGPVDLASLQSALRADPAWAWLRTLRLHAPLGRPASWRPVGAADEGCGVVDVDDLDAPWAALAACEGRLDAPLVRLDVARDRAGRTGLVLSWHHALLDARGAETLLRRLGGDAEVADVELAPAEAPAPGTWVERLMRARDARDFLFDVSAGRVGTVVGPPGEGARPRFRVIALTEDETARADRRAAEAGAHVVRSALALVAVARAVRAVRHDRGEPARDLLVPVPQDQRRRGAQGPIVGNRIGTFFYRMSDADLVDARTGVAAVTAQLRESMRSRWQETYTELLSLCRHLPLGFYWKVVSGPTEGAVASFGFSDTGDSLGKLTTLFGAPVRGAVHYPANLHPPGLTVISSRVGRRLQLTVSWFEGGLADAEVDHLEATLRRELVGG